jgi:hypothetical protein
MKTFNINRKQTSTTEQEYTNVRVKISPDLNKKNNKDSDRNNNFFVC